MTSTEEYVRALEVSNDLATVDPFTVRRNPDAYAGWAKYEALFYVNGHRAGVGPTEAKAIERAKREHPTGMPPGYTIREPAQPAKPTRTRPGNMWRTFRLSLIAVHVASIIFAPDMRMRAILFCFAVLVTLALGSIRTMWDSRGPKEYRVWGNVGQGKKYRSYNRARNAYARKAERGGHYAMTYLAKLDSGTGAYSQMIAQHGVPGEPNRVHCHYCGQFTAPALNTTCTRCAIQYNRHDKWIEV